MSRKFLIHYSSLLGQLAVLTACLKVEYLSALPVQRLRREVAKSNANATIGNKAEEPSPNKRQQLVSQQQQQQLADLNQFYQICRWIDLIAKSGAINNGLQQTLANPGNFGGIASLIGTGLTDNCRWLQATGPTGVSQPLLTGGQQQPPQKDTFGALGEEFAKFLFPPPRQSNTLADIFGGGGNSGLGALFGGQSAGGLFGQPGVDNSQTFPNFLNFGNSRQNQPVSTGTDDIQRLLGSFNLDGVLGSLLGGSRSGFRK